MVRNITGRTIFTIKTDSGSQGALNSFQEDEYFTVSVDPNITRYRATQIVLDASKNMGDISNPMAGHANGSDIHPYSIKLLPILIY